jgi:hypothetical protein
MDNNTTIIAMAATTIIAFFFGKAGALQKILDFVLGQKKHKELSIEETIAKKDLQIKELSEVLEKFKVTCNDLNLKLVQANTYMIILLAYLEKSMPDNVSPFIVEMANEIRKHQTEHKH